MWVELDVWVLVGLKFWWLLEWGGVCNVVLVWGWG